MSNLDDFFSGVRDEPVVIPPVGMAPGTVIAVSNVGGEVLHRFTATFVPKGVAVDVGETVEYVDATGKRVRGKVLHVGVDPISKLDVVDVEEHVVAGLGVTAERTP